MAPRVMTPSPADAIGKRIRTIRKRRGLSIETAAGFAGITKGYLSLIENGHRRVSRRGLLDDIASALGCSVVDLTGEPYVPADGPSATALTTIPPIQLALMDCDLDDVPDQPARPIAALLEAVRDSNLHRDRTRYEIAGRDLGQVLVELQITAAAGDEAQQRAALAGIVEACLVAYEITKNLGHPQLAVEAARRGLDAARRLGDPALLGFARWYYSLSLMRLGVRRRANTTLVAAVDELSDLANPAADETLAAQVLGLLHLTSALEAARSQRADVARAHLAEAKSIAVRTGEQNDLMQHFGPANVSAWTLSIEVELGEGPAAAEAAKRTPVDLKVFDSANRTAAWHYDLARALAQDGGRRDVEAVRHLDLAERTAPQRLRHDPIARELGLELKGRARTTMWELDSLLNRFGLSSQ